MKRARLSVALLAVLTSMVGYVVYRNQPPSPVRAAQTPMQTYSLYAGLWRVDGGFDSTIRVKNSLIVGPMELTPVLYMADGTPYELASQTIATAGVVVIDVNAALRQAPPFLAGHLSTYGSAEVRYQYANPGHVNASVQMLNIPASLNFTNSLGFIADGTEGQHMVEGVWWRRDPGVDGFVSVANFQDGPAQVTVQAIGAHGMALPAETLLLASHATQLLDLDSLTGELPGAENQGGGLRVQYAGKAGSVVVTGGLVNQQEGYSANMPFCPHDMGAMDPVSLTFASAGIMVGAQDPMMGFPPGTRFAPYAIVRNTTSAPIKLSPVLNYMAGSAPVTRPLHAQTLAPFEARQLDLPGIMAALGLGKFDGMINLSFSFTGRPGEVILANGSVDQTGNYVFEVEPEGVGKSGSKEASYWSVAEGFDTMFSVWNPTSTAEDLTVTFYYADGSGKYTLPVHLDGNASTMIDIMMLRMSGQPDQNGELFSATATQGSAVFANAQGYMKPITAVVSVGTFNAQTATCCTNKVNCCGYSGFKISPNPIYCLLNESMQCSAQATNCNGGVDTSVTWSSNNTSVATINSSGLMTGVGPGSATIAANFGQVQVFTGTLCPPQTCPLAAESASSAANIAYLTCGAATRGSSLTCQINNLPPGATISNWKFTQGTNTVTTSSTSSSWSGTAVQSGTVSVTVASGGTSSSLTSAWTVNARTGWAFTAVSPVKVANGAGTGGCAGILVVLRSPPQAFSDLGQSCLFENRSWAPNTVSGGPNNGYNYTTSPSNTTIYQWQRSPDLDNTASVFYTKQTGTYNASTDPNGCISGSSLAAQTQRHEIGSVQGHWGEYKTSQDNTSNNVGTIIEGRVGPPSQTQTAFQDQLNSDLNAAQTRINNDFNVEPYGANYDQNGKFLGNVNFAPGYSNCQ